MNGKRSKLNLLLYVLYDDDLIAIHLSAIPHEIKAIYNFTNVVARA